MAEEQLYGAQIFRAPIHQRGFRAPQRMGSIRRRAETDLPHPPADDPRVLPATTDTERHAGRLRNR